jgi:hypothetical protein
LLIEKLQRVDGFRQCCAHTRTPENFVFKSRLHWKSHGIRAYGEPGSPEKLLPLSFLWRSPHYTTFLFRGRIPFFRGGIPFFLRAMRQHMHVSG